METSNGASATRAILLVLAMSACVRLWGTFEDPALFFDEINHVPSALSLGEHGTTLYMNWFHPPLSGLMLWGTISALGDNPWGWRLDDVLFGTGSVLLVYLVARRLFPRGPVPVLSAALLGLDPLHVYFSRTTMMEIPVTFFFLLFLYAMVEFAEAGRATLPLAGVAAGLSLATKVYFAPAFPLVALWAYHRARSRGEPRGQLSLDLVLTQVVLPASVVLLAYFRWFGRGYGLLEFVRMQLDGLRTLQEMQLEQLQGAAGLQAGGQPWEWFLKVKVIGSARLLEGGEWGVFKLQIGSPLRLLVLPALGVVCWQGWRRRAARELLIPVLFLAVHLPIFVARRPVFSYSALAVLPLAYLLLARAVALVGERLGRERLVTAAFLGVVVLWGACTFPVVAGTPVPIEAYRPLLGIARTWEG